MKFVISMLFLFPLFVTFPAFSEENTEENTVSISEERKRTIQYGIDSEILPLIEELREEENENFIEEMAELLTTTLNEEIKIACFNYLKELEKDIAMDEGTSILKDFEEYGPKVVKSAIEYVSAVKEKIDPDLVKPLIEADSEIAMSAITNFSNNKVDGLAGVLREKYERHDTTVNIRAEILLALGKLGDKSSKDLLESVAANEGEERILRHYACSALGEIGDPDSLGTLLEVYKSDDAVTRSYAFYGISKIDAKEADEILLRALRDSYWKIRVYACEGIGEKKLQQAVPALQYKAEKDPELQVRTAAIEALSAIGNGEALKTVYSVFEDENENTRERLSALEGLVEHHFPGSLPKIKEVFEKELVKKKSFILDPLCGTLSKQKAPGLADLYKKMLDHSSMTVKIYALRGIGHNSFQQLREEVERFTKDGMPVSLKKHALRALEGL